MSSTKTPLKTMCNIVTFSAVKEGLALALEEAAPRTYDVDTRALQSATAVTR